MARFDGSCVFGRRLAQFSSATCLLAVGLATSAHAAESIDLQALVEETQQSSSLPNEMRLVWWLPVDFWRASMAQDPTVTPESIEALVAVLRPYTMVVVVDGRVGPFGGFTFEPEEKIRKAVVLEDSEGEQYRPLDPKELSPDAKNFLLAMKPILASQMGAVGENMQIIAFPGTDAKGRPIADASKEGRFKVVVDGSEFAFRLPLGSLLPPMYDRKSGEKFPGNHRYNPFTGRRLSSDPPKERK